MNLDRIQLERLALLVMLRRVRPAIDPYATDLLVEVDALLEEIDRNAHSLAQLLAGSRPARADDYEEPLRGMIERGEIEPPDQLVIED